MAWNLQSIYMFSPFIRRSLRKDFQQIFNFGDLWSYGRSCREGSHQTPMKN